MRNAPDFILYGKINQADLDNQFMNTMFLCNKCVCACMILGQRKGANQRPLGQCSDLKLQQGTGSIPCMYFMLNEQSIEITHGGGGEVIEILKNKLPAESLLVYELIFSSLKSKQFPPDPFCYISSHSLVSRHATSPGTSAIS